MTQPGDIFNKWASKSYMERFCACYTPGAPQSAVAALELVYQFGKILYYPVSAYYAVKVTMLDSRPGRWKVCGRMLLGIVRGEK